jgi:phenylalanine-4-hydroxylase
MNTASDLPPPGAAADWTVDQNWAHFTGEEHARWDRLYARQMELLPGRACRPFLEGLRALDLGTGGVPDFAVLNASLEPLTGWRVVTVPGLVPDGVFFEHLANRRFPAGNFLRSQAEFDYIEAPDVFHDVFGHVPLLTNPVFADYMQAYGAGGLRALGLDVLPQLARLYWYTVEFGLIEEEGALRIYGAGILSSPAECVYSVESARPARLGFALERLMRTRYRIDDVQETYFVIQSFQDLFDATLQDFAPIYQRLRGAPEIGPRDIGPEDRLVGHPT